MLASGRLALVAAVLLVLVTDPALSTAPAGGGGPKPLRPDGLELHTQVRIEPTP